MFAQVIQIAFSSQILQCTKGRPQVLGQTIVLRLGLKGYLERYMSQFIVYIWFVAQRHNINNYVDEIKHEINIVIDTWARILHKKCSFFVLQS
jgi:hypothetical protein